MILRCGNYVSIWAWIGIQKVCDDLAIIFVDCSRLKTRFLNGARLLFQSDFLLKHVVVAIVAQTFCIHWLLSMSTLCGLLRATILVVAVIAHAFGIVLTVNMLTILNLLGAIATNLLHWIVYWWVRSAHGCIGLSSHLTQRYLRLIFAQTMVILLYLRFSLPIASMHNKNVLLLDTRAQSWKVPLIILLAGTFCAIHIVLKFAVH